MVDYEHFIAVGAANHPENDTDPVGGAMDDSVKVSWEDISSVQVEIVSSNAGDTTQTVTIHGRNAAKQIVNEVATLNGTTPVQAASPITFNRLEKAIKSGTTSGVVAVMSVTNEYSDTSSAGGSNYADLASGSASNTLDAYRFMVGRVVSGTGAGQIFEVLKYEGSAGANPYRIHFRTLATPLDATSVIEIAKGMVFDKVASASLEILEVRRFHYNVAAEETGGSAVVTHEKGFFLNLHATEALLSATVSEVAEGLASLMDFGLEDSLDGTGSAANRLTAPGGITFNSSDKAVAGDDLLAGSAQGFWTRLSLPAGQSAQNSYYKLQVSGQSA